MFLIRALFFGAAAVTAMASSESERTCEAFGSAGECAPEAQQGRALLQTKSPSSSHVPLSLEADHVATVKMPPPIALFDGKGGVMAKFQELERKVHTMHAEGQNPVGISEWINSQLLPMSNMTKQELQGEVNRAQQAVDGCATALGSAEVSAQEQETTLSIGESRHNECTLLQAQKTKEAQDDCAGVQAVCDTIEAPVDMATVDLNSTEAVEDALQALYRFFESEYPKFIDEDHTCSAAQDLAQQQAQQCEADQAGIEASYCSLKAGRAQICSDYDACFVEKAEIFTKVVDDVRAVEAHMKSSFKTLTCFGRTVLQDMDQGSRPTCNASQVDTTYLNVFYPSAPSKESCSDTVSTSWNYSATLCDGGDDFVATTGAPEGGNVTDGNTSLFLKETHQPGASQLHQATEHVVAAKHHAQPHKTVHKTAGKHHLKPSSKKAHSKRKA